MTEKTALNFTVPDMDCGGCVRSITSAVQRVDAQAVVDADLASKNVAITGAQTAAAYRAAIEGAGFTVTA